MSKFHPTGVFKWIDPKEFDLNKYSNNRSKVDFEYPKQLREYTVLEFQFRSVKCTVVTKISSNFPLLSKRQLQCSDVNNSLQKVFKRVYTIYTYSNCTINQLLHCWQII